MTRELLIDAAVTAFAAGGYAGTTIDQIANAAGASRATFYLHFTTKGDLLHDLIARATTSFAPTDEALTAALRSRDPGTIRAWILESMHRWDDVADLMRPVYEAAYSDASTFRELFPDDIPGVATMAEALVVAGVSTADTAELTAVILFAPLQLLFRKHLAGERFDHALAAELIADAWTDAVTHAAA